MNAFIDRPQHAQFILFISFALIITGLHLVLFGPDPRPIQIIESMQSYAIGPLRLDVVRTQAARDGAGLIGVLMLFLKYSRLGSSIRAAADNLIGAQVIGIRVRKRLCGDRRHRHGLRRRRRSADLAAVRHAAVSGDRFHADCIHHRDRRRPRAA